MIKHKIWWNNPLILIFMIVLCMYLKDFAWFKFLDWFIINHSVFSVFRQSVINLLKEGLLLYFNSLVIDFTSICLIWNKHRCKKNLIFYTIIVHYSNFCHLLYITCAFSCQNECILYMYIVSHFLKNVVDLFWNWI